MSPVRSRRTLACLAGLCLAGCASAPRLRALETRVEALEPDSCNAHEATIASLQQELGRLERELSVLRSQVSESRALAEAALSSVRTQDRGDTRATDPGRSGELPLIPRPAATPP